MEGDELGEGRKNKEIEQTRGNKNENGIGAETTRKKCQNQQTKGATRERHRKRLSGVRILHIRHACSELCMSSWRIGALAILFLLLLRAGFRDGPLVLTALLFLSLLPVPESSRPLNDICRHTVLDDNEICRHADLDKHGSSETCDLGQRDQPTLSIAATCGFSGRMGCIEAPCQNKKKIKSRIYHGVLRVRCWPWPCEYSAHTIYTVDLAWPQAAFRFAAQPCGPTPTRPPDETKSNASRQI